MTDQAYIEATRTSWDAIAAAYASDMPAFTDNADDQEAVDAFIAVVRGPVADIGCGPGQTTGYLHSRGAEVFGIDLSPGMLAVARESHPDLRFDEGSMTALKLADGELDGILSWYSIVNIPPDLLPTVFAEFHRVLAPGGHVLLAFRVGENDVKHYDEGYGHQVSLDFHRHSPDQVTTLLDAAGLTLVSSQFRDSADIPQAILVARRPLDTAV
jgi:ubiquinone/menaquinone biosynthesis C-methylase UbiE